MNIKEVFKKYPENEPNYNGINYLVLLEVHDEILYGIEYYSDDAEFNPKFGKVVAFTELDPRRILNEI